MRLAVFGMGYLGATHAACMAELGHDVVGVDTSSEKITKLTAGELPFFEPGLDELVRRHVRTGRLRFSTKYEAAADFADAHFIAVGTPQRRDSQAADLSFVEAVVDGLAPLLTRPAVIFGKSTVPVGTAARLTQRLAARASVEVELAWNPEFLREGFAVDDTLHPDRTVLGINRQHGINQHGSVASRAEVVAREIYASAITETSPLLITDLATAELTKLAANSFLATKISFINGIAELCDAAGADVTTLADAIGYDTRIGRRFLNAGLGFGGGCLGKDIRSLQACAADLGVADALAIVREADRINLRQRQRVVDLTTAAVGILPKARIAIWGAAFKPNTDDVRDSPALDVARRLIASGAAVRLFDPQAMDNAARVLPQLELADTPKDAAKGADALLVLTEWQQFADLDPAELTSTVSNPVVIDARNCLDPHQWQAAGWTYHGLGRTVQPD